MALEYTEHQEAACYMVRRQDQCIGEPKELLLSVYLRAWMGELVVTKRGNLKVIFPGKAIVAD